MLQLDATYEETLHAFLADAKQDAVAFQQLEARGSHDLGLSGEMLDKHIKKYIHGLLSSGTIPVRSEKNQDNYYWITASEYVMGVDDSVTKIFNDWKCKGSDFDFYVWFTFPENIKASVARNLSHTAAIKASGETKHVSSQQVERS